MPDRQAIPVFMVNGFLEAGKTSYINRIFSQDFFYKRGRTLLLSFEEGEAAFDTSLLAERNTILEIYDGSEDLKGFLQEMVLKHQPDRIYMETNSMLEPLWELIAELHRVVFSVTIVDGATLQIYYNNMQSYLKRMIEHSQMVIIRAENKESITSMGGAMRLLNTRCDFLWQSPMGYTEKAFGIEAPYPLSVSSIAVSEELYLPWYLDAAAHPEHYEGKEIRLEGQLEISESEECGRIYKIGRRVMSCCPADIAFLSFIMELEDAAVSRYQDLTEQSWLYIVTQGKCRRDKYGEKRLCLQLKELKRIPAKAHPVIGL